MRFRLALWIGLLSVLVLLPRVARAERFYVRENGQITATEGDPERVNPPEWVALITSQGGKQWGMIREKTYAECARKMAKLERMKDPTYWAQLNRDDKVTSWDTFMADWNRRDYATIKGPIAWFPNHFPRDTGPMPRAAAMLVIGDWITQVTDVYQRVRELERAAEGLPPDSPIMRYVGAVVSAADKLRRLKKLVDQDPTLDRLTGEMRQMFDDTQAAVAKALAPPPTIGLTVGGAPWHDLGNAPGIQYQLVTYVYVDPNSRTKIGCAFSIRNEGTAPPDLESTLQVRVQGSTWWPVPLHESRVITLDDYHPGTKVNVLFSRRGLGAKGAWLWKAYDPDYRLDPD